MKGSGEKPAAVVLAGGESRRLGVASKALVDVGGVPMIGRVLERLRPQVGRIVVSVREVSPAFAALGLPLVADAVERQRGPLTGLYSALADLRGRAGGGAWLQVCPCDAPFLPDDLVDRLAQGTAEAGEPVCAAAYDGVVQPTFSLWHVDVLPTVREWVLERGAGGLMSVLDVLPHAVVDWPFREPSPFFNVNSPEDLEEARARFA